MKKIVSVLTALISVCVICVTAMAATSSPMKEIVPVNGTVTTTDGETITINDSDTLSKYLKITKTDTPAEDLPGYSAIGAFDVEFTGITSADVVLHVPGVKAGDTVIVRMYVNGEWVDVEAEVVGDNEVRVKFTQPGTYEILKAVSSNGNNGNGNGSDASGNNGTSGNTTGTNTSTKSPKTGESNALPAAYAVFALCVVAGVTAGSKLRKKA